jgi:hypothetical protein
MNLIISIFLYLSIFETNFKNNLIYSLFYSYCKNMDDNYLNLLFYLQLFYAILMFIWFKIFEIIDLLTIYLNIVKLLLELVNLWINCKNYNYSLHCYDYYLFDQGQDLIVEHINVIDEIAYDFLNLLIFFILIIFYFLAFNDYSIFLSILFLIHLDI